MTPLAASAQGVLLFAPGFEKHTDKDAFFFVLAQCHSCRRTCGATGLFNVAAANTTMAGAARSFTTSITTQPAPLRFRPWFSSQYLTRTPWRRLPSRPASPRHPRR